MQRSREQILEWEARWRTPVAAATILGVVLLVASLVVVSGIGGDGSAEFLREVDRDSSRIVLSGVLQTIGFFLLGAALVYLFRAAQGRSEKVRSQLIGLFVVAPIFLGLGAGLNSLSTTEAADTFVAGEASADLTRADAGEECRDERDDDRDAFADDYPGGDPLAECVATKLEDDEADDAIAGASLKGIAFGLQIAGMLGLAFSLMYGCLNAMRAGLLTRFWGSLGMALGVAAIFALPLTWLWFLYFGFLLLGAVPGGRPPAWETGEAVPWPSPGERAAAEIEAEPRDPDEPRRKRKQRE
ncbi:MAG TPA: hypothetical protein VK889_03755 [Solirubrobacterales bacterium]|nr:hypothetical protein [Solirubrobacterales bacterium]